MMTQTVHEGRIPDALIETVRERTDIVAVVSQHLALRKSGGNFVGLCPFHAEKTPSFVVNPAKQFFHCFGCAAGGDAFHFLSQIEQITFPEAVRRLAEKSGVTIPSFQNADKAHLADSESEQIYQINEKAARIFHQNLLQRKEAEGARKYLKERGISEETIQTFGIGYALPLWDDMAKRLQTPIALLEKGGLVKRGERGIHDTFRDRIILPIKTAQGRIIGFGGRVLNDTLPKYLNTSETSVFTKGKHLFAGLDLSRGKKSLIVVEGYFDLISLVQNGVVNVVATMGTAITPDHLQSIRRYVEKVFLILDPDTAGVAAMRRAAPLFIESGIAAEVILLPQGCDPDLFIRQQGLAAFQELLNHGKPLIDFVILQAAGTSTPPIEHKTKSFQELFPLIHKMANRVEQGYYLKHIAESFGVDEKDVRADFEKGVRPPVGRPLPLVAMGDRSATVSSGGASHLPEDEETLLALFIQDRLDPAKLNLIHPDDFITPRLKNLIAFFWNDESRGWYRPQGLLRQLGSAEKAIFTALSVLDIPSETQARLEEDCIGSLQTKRLRRETQKIQKELKSAEREGDHTRAASLQHAFFNLKKEISQIASHQNR